jgi:hypothetical protein
VFTPEEVPSGKGTFSSIPPLSERSELNQSSSFADLEGVSDMLKGFNAALQ